MNYYPSQTIAFLITLIVFSSCDKIDPDQYFSETNTIDSSCEPSSFTKRENPVRKILLEDFTGHQCGSCPAATLKIKKLVDEYGDQIVPVAIHAGGFADLLNEEQFNYDFTTKSGDEYDRFFGVSAVGNPNGLINRSDYPENHILTPFKWNPIASRILDTAPEVDIQINAVYNENIDAFCIDTYYEFLKEMPGQYRLTVLIIENEIVNWQSNYENGDPNYPLGYVENYIHQHVLRAGVNGTWGQDIKSSNLGSTEIIRYGAELGPDWKKEHLEIVAFVYNVDTYEVIQAEKTHLN